MESDNQLMHVIDEFVNDKFVQATISNPIIKDGDSKVKIRPVLIKNKVQYQETRYHGTQVFHKNYAEEELKERIYFLLNQQFLQGEILTEHYSYHILISKNGKLTIKRKSISEQQMNISRDFSHNREKKYVLEEGIPVDFLVGLGVQTQEGKVVHAKYDKFRQINRFLEFIEDIVTQLPKERTIRIIDFGCGKSYLTFAMYYDLHILHKLDIEVTGLDLKEDVIDHCNKLANQYHYDKLHFEKGNIKDYSKETYVDMVVTLHACDTATDFAIEKAIHWNSKVIMVVPCCQHEVNKQIKCDPLEKILKYGLLKERISALLTDGIRANLLEEMGYDTQVLEFIDMEHTPKNILIRAVKKDSMRKKAKVIKETTDFLHVETTLQKLLLQEDNRENS